MLLPKLPAQHDYKVIFMTRPIDEIYASQKEMIERLGTRGAEIDPAEMKHGMSVHSREMRIWLQTQPNVQSLEIDFPSLVRDPQPQISRLIDFLGPEKFPHESEMASAIDPSLHRNKSQGPPQKRPSSV